MTALSVGGRIVLFKNTLRPKSTSPHVTGVIEFTEEEALGLSEALLSGEPEEFGGEKTYKMSIALWDRPKRSRVYQGAVQAPPFKGSEMDGADGDTTEESTDETSESKTETPF